ncbi:uncharacterized protein E0L32_006241 [Thyridium curvatum]|uniref:Uncharacterized protein n=1 Tax=Thyridium curvatum TaxID=1093900 RepID=A0A507B909_9PEZI|nr:uncharacterized protein E0L32_006241 [Thyridium curvatum]TPX13268.1 hypothetical protein E0L32_006241 [Thyridium curvatum]
MSSTVTYSRRKNSRSAMGEAIPFTLAGDLGGTKIVAKMPSRYQRGQRGFAGVPSLSHNDKQASLLATTENDVSPSISTSGRRLSDLELPHPEPDKQSLRRPSLPRSHTTCNDMRVDKTRSASSRGTHLESLAKLEGNAKGALSSSATLASDINMKVEAMLAATASLKPEKQYQAEQNNSSGPSMLSRLKSTKFFSKVSHKVSQTVHDKWNGNKLKEVDDLPPLPVTPCALRSVKLSPVSALALRLNEGDNLNKYKVKKLTGGKTTEGAILRKPLPSQASSTILQDSSRGPFHQPAAGSSAQTSCDTRSTHSATDLATYTPHTPSPDPFESENIMEGQHNYLLECEPVGSSTPRKRKSAHDLEGLVSPAASQTTSDIQTDEEDASDNTVLHRMVEGNSRDSQVELEDEDSDAETSSSDEDVGLYPALPTPSNDSDPSGSLLRKKHPSPTRRQLRSLQRRVESPGFASRRPRQVYLTPTPELSASRARRSPYELGSPVKKDQNSSRLLLKPKPMHAAAQLAAHLLEDDVRTKRHPSPSRDELDELSFELHRMMREARRIPGPSHEPKQTTDNHCPSAESGGESGIAGENRGRTGSCTMGADFGGVFDSKETDRDKLLGQDVRDELTETGPAASKRLPGRRKKTLSQVAVCSSESDYEDMMAEDELQGAAADP